MRVTHFQSAKRRACHRTMIYILAVPEKNCSSIHTLEWAVSIALMLLLVRFHFIAAASAGGLWRDETNTVSISNLPGVWQHLQYDSFPLLWFSIVRCFSNIFGAMNDTAFRALGFFIGLGVMGALWLNARSFGHTFPFFSLTLFALSPSVICWGDSMRAYGFGLLLILVTCSLLWQFVKSPTWTRFAFTALAALCSVQTLFYNPILILAFCTGAVAVCLRARSWTKAVKVVSVGALAAISILPYASTIRNASHWNAIVRIDAYTLSWFYNKMNDTLSPAGAHSLALWLILWLAAVTVAVYTERHPLRLNLCPARRSVILFASVALVVGTLAQYAFLKILSYHTQPWYYLTLLALTAVMIDAIFGAIIITPRARLARLGFVVFAFSLSFSNVDAAVRQRMTNVDLIAELIEKQAVEGDFVVVTPWNIGVPFARYYNGPAAWLTIPEISFHHFHRYDLLKISMTEADQEAPVRHVMDRIARTLQSGHRVFLVGELTLPPPGQRPGIFPPAPLSKWRWQDVAYIAQWSQMVGYFVHTHALTITEIPVSSGRRISDYENMKLGVIEGWAGE